MDPVIRTADDPVPEELPPPVGTLFLMMVYIMVLAGMWAALYFDFLGR
ncbi:MAG: hypothetical protein WEA09_07585 [Gemmatimonadota bacterium]